VDITSLYVDIATKNSEWGRGEIVNSTWTSQFVFKNLISFQRITFGLVRFPVLLYFTKRRNVTKKAKKKRDVFVNGFTTWGVIQLSRKLS